MLATLASGTLARDPKSGTSATGTRWANSTIRVSTGNDREGNALTSFVTILAFNDDADRLAKLGKGDAISVQGPLKQTEYTKDGETRHGLEILVNGILTVHDKRKKASEANLTHASNSERQRVADFGGRANVRHAGHSTRYDFNDELGF